MTGATADVSNCVFKGGAAAIESNLTGKVYIRHSDFVESQIGIKLSTSSDATGSANIRSCEFSDCGTGVSVIHNGTLSNLSSGSYPFINSSNFINCKTGLDVKKHPAVKVQGSTFTSSGVNNFAVKGLNSGEINMINCDVFGYSEGDGATAITLDNTDELILDAGRYYNNGRVTTIHSTSNVTLTECVEFINNADAGVYCLFRSAGSTIDFNGSSWMSTVGVKSTSATISITDTKANSYVHPGDHFLQVNSAANVTMNNDNWTGQTTLGIPNANLWFDLIGSGNPSVIVNTISTGCGSDCQTPDDCRRFCEYYPENKLCKIESPGGIFKDKEKGMTLFPNPANGQVTIANLPDDQSFNLTVFSSTGQVIQQLTNLESPVQELETSELIPGFYSLQLTTADGDSQQLRFSIVR